MDTYNTIFLYILNNIIRSFPVKYYYLKKAGVLTSIVYFDTWFRHKAK